MILRVVEVKRGREAVILRRGGQQNVRVWSQKLVGKAVRGNEDSEINRNIQFIALETECGS